MIEQTVESAVCSRTTFNENVYKSAVWNSIMLKNALLSAFYLSIFLKTNSPWCSG